MKRKDKEMIRDLSGKMTERQAKRIREEKRQEKREQKKKVAKQRLIVFGVVVIVALIVAGVFILINSSGGENNTTDITEPNKELSGRSAVVKTPAGQFTVELFGDKAPKAVEKFITVAGEGHYDDSFFHRISDDGFIECAINENSPGRPGFDTTMDTEVNGLAPEAYSVVFVPQPDGPGMMKTGFFRIYKEPPTDPTTAGTVFGKVVGGKEVVDMLLTVEKVLQPPDKNYDVPSDEVSYPYNIDDVRINTIDIVD